MRYDAAFANAKHIPGGNDYPARWEAEAEAFRTSLGTRARLGLPYGGGKVEWFDLFLPEGESAGLLVFIHGGEWLAFSPRDFSHIAAGALARGWAVAMPAYTLAPAAMIPEMTRQVASAVTRAAAEVAGPVVITGHSAGGHLAARMAAADMTFDPFLAARIARVVPISPLADLRPLRETSMNAVLRIDDVVARSESPVLLAPRSGVKIHIWVGGEERPAYRDQSRRLGNAWACPVTVEPGRHHFDVMEGMETVESPLMQVLIGQASRP
ncbi:MAG TPA: alpha/beta hydrolase [Albidovulum sp.]|uniref:alpha/beta hydrolase n=1 Tax=Albidovulum sp. TaxID=1872424 RepID=UPI002C4C65F7|nr:alpha/beta hydrolase [Albidovulum sp.]